MRTFLSIHSLTFLHSCLFLRPVWASDEWLQKYAGASLAEGGVGQDRPGAEIPGLKPGEQKGTEVKEKFKRGASEIEGGADQPVAKKRTINPQSEWQCAN